MKHSALSASDPVLEAYKSDLDWTLLRLAEEARKASRLWIRPTHPGSRCRLLTQRRHYPAARQGAPDGLPFRWDTDTIHRGLNFTLTTDLGDLDLLGEITGGSDYEALQTPTITLELFGMEVLFLDLDWLIRVKRAAGRPRDLEVLAELEAIQDHSSEG